MKGYRHGQVIKFTEAEFPILSGTTVARQSQNKDWINKKKNADVLIQKHDIFEGKCNDETGMPMYGKISFVNGDIYEGPIFTSFPKYNDDEGNDDEREYVEDEYDEDEYDEDEYDEDKYDEDGYDEGEYEKDPYENYGEMIYKDGTSFWGIFCFGQSVIKNLKIST